MDSNIIMLDKSRKKWELLKKRVEKAGGRAIIIMHAFYGNPRHQQYLSVLGGLLKRSKKPVIMLEPEFSLVSFEKRVRGLGEVFLVPTRAHIPSMEASGKYKKDVEMLRSFFDKEFPCVI